MLSFRTAVTAREATVMTLPSTTVSRISTLIYFFSDLVFTALSFPIPGLHTHGGPFFETLLVSARLQQPRSGARGASGVVKELDG